jgi:hypothetical protein
VLRGFDDGEHGVRHGESVRPVVIGDVSVVFAYCQCEPDHVVQVKPSEQKKRVRTNEACQNKRNVSEQAQIESYKTSMIYV